MTLAAKVAACESNIFWTASGSEASCGRERPRAAVIWIVSRPEMGSSSGSSWGSGVVGGGVGAPLWRPLSLNEGVSALVSAGECEHCVSITVVIGSEEKNLLFLQDMVGKGELTY